MDPKGALRTVWETLIKVLSFFFLTIKIYIFRLFLSIILRYLKLTCSINKKLNKTVLCVFLNKITCEIEGLIFFRILWVVSIKFCYKKL